MWSIFGIKFSSCTKVGRPLTTMENCLKIAFGKTSSHCVTVLEELKRCGVASNIAPELVGEAIRHVEKHCSEMRTFVDVRVSGYTFHTILFSMFAVLCWFEIFKVVVLPWCNAVYDDFIGRCTRKEEKDIESNEDNTLKTTLLKSEPQHLELHQHQIWDNSLGTQTVIDSA